MPPGPARLLARTAGLALLAAIASGALSACAGPDFMTYPAQTRGNKVDPELLAQLVPGTSSRADAIALIGSPTAKATFDDNSWIYIGEVTKPVIGGRLDVRDQEVVVLTFDQGGTLRKIEKKGQDDGQNIAIVSRTTPSPGNNATILQQLLGNVGRFSPSPTGTQDQNTIGGAGGANKF